MPATTKRKPTKASKQTSAKKLKLPKSPVRPVRDNMIIVPDEVLGKTKGGIIIPEPLKKRTPPSKGHIIAIGMGRFDKDGGRVPQEFKVGQHVMFTVMGAHAFMDDKGGKFLLVREPDIIGVIEGDLESDIPGS